MDWSDKQTGNGGFVLRRREIILRMLELEIALQNMDLYEDVWFNKKIEVSCVVLHL